MSFITKQKDPDAVLDYLWPWAEQGWLPADDTIADAVFTVTTADPPFGEIPVTDTNPVVVDSSSFTDTDATAWLSGGSAPAYLVTCRITTAAGRIDDRTLRLKVTQK